MCFRDGSSYDRLILKESCIWANEIDRCSYLGWNYIYMLDNPVLIAFFLFLSALLFQVSHKTLEVLGVVSDRCMINKYTVFCTLDSVML